MTDLEILGWRPFFATQLDADSGHFPARVMAVHRGRIEVAGQHGDLGIALTGRSADIPVAIGDWVVVDAAGPRLQRCLERFSTFRRGAPGTGHTTQLIAANVDTLFIVTSANRDFNTARLERYLAIAQEAGVYPVVVITKADTVDSVAEFVAAASKLAPGLLVEAIDARDAGSVACLRQWCGPGQTAALLGSSGVGKSTLVNTLASGGQVTQAVREDDQRGRHTTTRRSMHRLPEGGWLVDTPGMRELQLVDIGDALDDVFTDVAALAVRCRFTDCHHADEPGCAVQAAIDEGGLDPERLRRYRKLEAEDRRSTENVAERRARDRNLGQLYKSIQSGKRRRKGDE